MDEAIPPQPQIGPEREQSRKPEKAFVIHAELMESRGRMRGRVEHLVSGRAAWFTDLNALVEFVKRINSESKVDRT